MPNKKQAPMFENAYMAHAFGGYEGHKYTNTVEAFDHAIDCGFHYMETDLSLTCDDVLVCSHGFGKKDCAKLDLPYEPWYETDMTYEKFMELTVYDQHFMDATMLYERMLQYPYLYMEIDLKTLPADKARKIATKLVEAFQHNDEVLGRLLIQVNSEQMYEAIDEVYHFSYYQFNFIKARYEAGDLDQIIAYCVEKDICAIALKEAYATEETIGQIKTAGLCILAYTIDSRKKAEKLLAAGVDTICTNYINLFISQKNTDEAEIRQLYLKYHRLPIAKNKIVFSNFHGKSYGCNPKFITEQLLKCKEAGADLDIVWLSRNPRDCFPEGVRRVTFHSENAIMEMATARVLVDNQMKFPGFVKREDQYFIETWHGAIPLKKLAMDNPENIRSNGYRQRMHATFDAVDVVLSNSDFCSHMFRRGFEYQGWLLTSGCPRNDLFLEDNRKYKEEVCKMLGISETAKLLLYAPTFRDDHSLDAYDLDYEKLAQSLGEEWVVLIRLHPHLQKKASYITYNDKVVNASVAPDMQVLMAASDVLVTDYSNIMFEFMLTGRPCLLYATDIEAYKKERDYYFEFSDLPFPVTTTQQELVQNIQNFDHASYEAGIESFSERVKLVESGKASQKVTDLILEMTKKDKVNFRKNGCDKQFLAEAKRCQKQREKEIAGGSANYAYMKMKQVAKRILKK